MAAAPSAFLEPTQLSVAPGSTAVAQLRIRNDGPTEERFLFEVAGAAAVWTAVSPFALTVAPGEGGAAQVVFRPPRSPTPAAGKHHIIIQVRASREQSQEVEVAAEVEVSPFIEVTAALDPADGPDRDSATRQLTIDNRGNAPARAAVKAIDAGRRLAITADPPVVTLLPGATTAVRLAVAGRRPVLGGPSDTPFTVVVEPDGGEPVQVEGTRRQKPVLTRPVRGAIAALAAVILVAALLGGVLRSPSPPSHARAKPIAAGLTGCPTAGHLAHDANGQIRHDVVEPDNFSFLFLQPGGCSPVRWDPCSPIHYVINGNMASPAQVADTRQALSVVAQATGISFLDDGTTTEDANRRQPFEPAVYGARWAPVLIDWMHFGATTSLTEAAGGGFPNQVKEVYVSGVVVLNLDAHLANNAPLPTGFGSGVTWGRIILHELGHVVGLGHVAGVEQIMHDPVTEQTSPMSAYGLGDLTGLRLLGRSAGCLNTPPPPAGAP